MNRANIEAELLAVFEVVLRQIQVRRVVDTAIDHEVEHVVIDERAVFEGSGARTFQAHPHLLLVPAVFVTSLMFSFNLLGDALNDAMRGR